MAYLPERLALEPKVGAPVIVECLATQSTLLSRYAGRVATVSAAVTEAPPRFRRMPDEPFWGRALVVALGDEVHLIPGETVTVSLIDPGNE